MLLYSLSGIFDDTEAKAYVTAATPTIYSNLYRQKIHLNNEGGGLWDVRVPYGPIATGKGAESQEGGSLAYALSFDTTGGTAHVTQAKEHIKDYAKPGVDDENAPNHKGAINVTENGPEGTDIVVGQFAWREQHEMPIARVSFDYANILKAITGRVNVNPFRGFPMGTVRFDGAVGGASSKDPTLAELTFHFTQSDHSFDAVPNFKPGIAKMGWEYLWMEYERVEDTDSSTMVGTPLAVHIEGVVSAADFSLMGIGS